MRIAPSPLLTVVGVVLVLVAGCATPTATRRGDTTATPSASSDSCIGNGCALSLAQTTAPVPAEVTTTPDPAPQTVTIKLAVHSVRGDFGDYIVDLHDGQVAKQTTFNVDRKGEWSKTILVPNASMVKLDIARTGATCDITLVDTGAVLIHDENSCIVGS